LQNFAKIIKHAREMYGSGTIPLALHFYESETTFRDDFSGLAESSQTSALPPPTACVTYNGLSKKGKNHSSPQERGIENLIPDFSSREETWELQKMKLAQSYSHHSVDKGNFLESHFYK
jgi:hypothetical protein